MTAESATRSAHDLATRYSELQQLRKQVEEAEKRQATSLAATIADGSSTSCAQDLAAC